MLVLSRKKNESIRIGDEIEVIVLEVSKNRVRLGFRCPAHIAISRKELQSLPADITLDLSDLESQRLELACA